MSSVKNTSLERIRFFFSSFLFCFMLYPLSMITPLDGFFTKKSLIVGQRWLWNLLNWHLNFVFNRVVISDRLCFYIIFYQIVTVNWFFFNQMNNFEMIIEQQSMIPKSTKQLTTDNERPKTDNEYAPYKRYWKKLFPTQKGIPCWEYLSPKGKM